MIVLKQSKNSELFLAFSQRESFLILFKRKDNIQKNTQRKRKLNYAKTTNWSGGANMEMMYYFYIFLLQCSFAHGEKELQPKTHLHEKYKTRPCNRYFSEGFCPYGIRCQYIHDELKDLQKFDKYLNDSYKRQLVKPPISSSISFK